MPGETAPAALERIAVPAIATTATEGQAGTDAAEAAWPAGTLREHSRKLIEDTLAAHGGNVSQAARQLRVSRGTLYRRLRGWHDDAAQAAADD